MKTKNERKIEETSLSIINKLPQILKPNEFVVAFFIINTMALNKKDRVRIYRGVLSDLCNMSERNISRITDRLNEIGIIEKQLIGDTEKKKTYNFFNINWQKTEEFLARFDKESDSFLPDLSENEENSARFVRLKECITSIEQIASTECITPTECITLTECIEQTNNINNNLPSINSIHVKTIHSQLEKEKDSKEKEYENFKNEVNKELEHCNTEVEVYAVKGNFLGKLEKKRALLGIQGFDWYSSILGSAIREKLSTLEQENLEEAEAQTSWTESLNK